MNNVNGLLYLNNSYNIFLIFNNFLIHNEALTYSASAVDVATIDCFLEFQDIGLFPINIIFPEVYFLSVISPAKSESI